MAKTAKSQKQETLRRAIYALHPWQCLPQGDGCELRAYVEASGEWETLAVVRATSGSSADGLADYIARTVNQSRKDGELLEAAYRALSNIVEEGLNFATEHEADRVIDKIKLRGL